MSVAFARRTVDKGVKVYRGAQCTIAHLSPQKHSSQMRRTAVRSEQCVAAAQWIHRTKMEKREPGSITTLSRLYRVRVMIFFMFVAFAHWTINSGDPDEPICDQILVLIVRWAKATDIKTISCHVWNVRWGKFSSSNVVSFFNQPCAQENWSCCVGITKLVW